MKTSTKTIVILKSLDLELKSILQQDLQNFKTAQQSKNNHAASKHQMAA